jgi:hypothetical protein
MADDSISLDFTPFHIFGADGHQYTGVRPSLIPKPFKSAVVVLNGKTFKPGFPKGYSRDQVFGYDAAVRMGINMTATGKKLSTDIAYRVVTILNDGKRWSKLVYPNGDIQEDWLH